MLIIGLVYTARVKNLTSINKYLLVRLQPMLRAGVVEGESSFDVNFSFSTSYSVTAASLGDSSETKEIAKSLSDEQAKSFKVSCSSSTLECDTFPIIYNPFVEDSTDHTIRLTFTKDRFNRNLVQGFKIMVTNFHLLTPTSRSLLETKASSAS